MRDNYSYEKLMRTQYGRLIDYVKFAEAKNAALLTFCSIWIGSLINMLRSSGSTLAAFDQAALVIVTLMLTMAALVALYSLLPKYLHRRAKTNDENVSNLLFFGDIAKLKIDVFAERLMDTYRAPDSDPYSQAYLDDLAVQIWAQSQIAHAKFKAFNRAAMIVLGAFVVAAIPLSISLAQWIERVGQTWQGRT